MTWLPGGSQETSGAIGASAAKTSFLQSVTVEMLNPSATDVQVESPERGKLRQIQCLEHRINPESVFTFGSDALKPRCSNLAFLPHIINASAAVPISGQLLILGALVDVMFSAANLVAVLLAGKLWKSGVLQRWLQRTGGTAASQDIIAVFRYTDAMGQ